jgi:hypothetical protein
MAHSKACAEATGKVVRGREGTRYQRVSKFDSHENRNQSAGQRNIDRGRRGEFYGVELADDGESYGTILGLVLPCGTT